MRTIFALLGLLGLMSCVGGGDGSSGGGSGGTSKTAPSVLSDKLQVEITPESATGEKVYGYDVADLTKIGGSAGFRIKITNPNDREILPPVAYYSNNINLSYPDAGPDGLAAPYFFIKTNDANDCMNIITLKAGASCTLKGKILWNWYTVDRDPLYGVPFSIDFRDPLNPLYTGHYFSSSATCGSASNSYKDCTDHSTHLFYRMNLAKRIPRIVTIGNGGFPSMDGNYVYSKDFSSLNGNKYKLIVDPNTGDVQLGASEKSFSYPSDFPNSVKSAYDGSDQYCVQLFGGVAAVGIYTSYDHDYSWESGHWTTPASTTYTPGLSYTNPFKVGADKSVWIGGTDRHDPHYAGFAKSLRNGESGMQFYETNIRSKLVYGVDTTGVVVIRTDDTYTCYRQKDPNNPRSYESQEITGYKTFDNYWTYINPSIYNGVYIPMVIPDTYNGEGFDGVGSAYDRSSIIGYFKIDTRDGKCAINPDKYIYFLENTDSYAPQSPDILEVNEKFWYYDNIFGPWAISMPIKDFYQLN